MGAGASQPIAQQHQPRQGQRDLSQYIFRIQQVQISIQNQLEKEKQKIKNLNEKIQDSKYNIDKEQTKFENLFMKKIEIQGQLSGLIQKLSSEKQKLYEKKTDELKKQANELNFEKKPTSVLMLKKASLNANQNLRDFFNEVEQLQKEFLQSQIYIIRSRTDVQIESDLTQFNKIYFEIKKIEMEMNTIEENFQKLSEELQQNNLSLSERKDFNEKMAASLIQYQIQVQTQFNDIFSQIDKQQIEQLQQTQIQLNKQKKLSQDKQADLDKQTEKINNLTKESQEFQNQISKYEFEKQDLEIKKQKIQQLKEEITNKENNLNSQIESLNKLKNENTQIIKEIQNLFIEFEEKISTFGPPISFKNNHQIEVEIQKINDDIQDQIRVSSDYNQIIDNFQQMMNKTIAILKIQNERLVNIQRELEKNQKINLENEEKIDIKDKEIFELRCQSKQKNKQIESLQNQIDELEQNNLKLKKELAELREHQEKKQQPIKLSNSRNFFLTDQQTIYESIYDEEVSKEIIAEQESCEQQFSDDNQFPSTAKSSLKQSFLKFPPIENTQNQQSRNQNTMRWIDIYYESQSPYTHSSCSKKAKVNSNAMVSCDGGCQSFQLKSAVFDLLNSQVYEQLNIQKLPKDHVQVGGKYLSLVESSLFKAGIIDKEKKDFKHKFRNSYSQQLDLLAISQII